MVEACKVLCKVIVFHLLFRILANVMNRIIQRTEDPSLVQGFKVERDYVKNVAPATHQ